MNFLIMAFGLCAFVAGFSWTYRSRDTWATIMLVTLSMTGSFLLGSQIVYSYAIADALTRGWLLAINLYFSSFGLSGYVFGLDRHVWRNKIGFIVFVGSLSIGGLLFYYVLI